MTITIVLLIVALLAVIALAAWERERASARHRDERDELQARIDALTVANSSAPETRRVYSELQHREIPLRPSSTWYDSKPVITPMRVIEDGESPMKKAGT